ncbi:GAF and ANTAR domain-containing protein [Demequina sp. SO4-18]|uniref:GAF and ANTAR domain-containing protein n=1 Tax=Demequina sp. SO4-18 TaxID=3401026 RepID=UPI003B5C3BA8
MTEESQDDAADPAARGPRGEASAQHSGSHSGEYQLAARLSRVARQLDELQTPTATLDEIVRTAVAMIPGADEGSISLVIGRRTVWSEGATGTLPRVVDALHEDTGEGPCMDAAYHQETIRVRDMSTETRWPLFASRAADAGARGMLALQLFVSGDDLGSLNLYSYEANAFGDASEDIGLLFASHAAIAYASVRRQAQLTAAVSSRLVIGQAQDVLIQRYGMDEGRAFQVLVRASQQANVKLREIAQQTVDARELPPSVRPPDLK